MTSNIGYFDYLQDKGLGSKISSISMIFGFIGFLLKERVVEGSGQCGLAMLEGLNSYLACYLILVGPFVFGLCIGTFIVFSSVRGVRCGQSDLRRLTQKIGRAKGSSSVDGCKKSRRRKFMLYLGIFILTVSPITVYLVLQPETYLSSDRNVFPIITLAIMFTVYSELFLAIIFCALHDKSKN